VVKVWVWYLYDYWWGTCIRLILENNAANFSGVLQNIEHTTCNQCVPSFTEMLLGQDICHVGGHTPTQDKYYLFDFFVQNSMTKNYILFQKVCLGSPLCYNYTIHESCVFIYFYSMCF
jgi:hypothetical protein